MRFFNLDMHVSVIEDIKTIFNDLGHQVDSKNISFHNWVFNRIPDKVDIISQNNWRNLSPELCEAFYDRYKDELSDYDGFIVTYPPSFSLLFEKFNKPIIAVAATRYEAPFSNDWNKWSGFNNFLREKIDEGLIIPVANNLYDKQFCEFFTEREWTHIPSLCEYTNLKYSGSKDDFILYTKSKDIKKSNILRKETLKDSSWKNLYSYKGIVHVPYNISTMSIFEQKTAGVPLIFPSLDYLTNMQSEHALSELFNNGMAQEPHGTTCEEWRDKEKIKLADFYNWNEVLYFDSEEHLDKLLNIVDFKKLSQRSLEENKSIKKETYEKWDSILSTISKREIIHKLAGVIKGEKWGGQPFSGEGSLFNNPNKIAQKKQIDFLTKHLKQLKPKTILETGTHTAFFDLLASEIIPEIKIYTFGISDFSSEAVKILKEERGVDITFYEGDSAKTLTDFNTKDTIDFAWVDGGHFGDVPIKDLYNCNRLNIPHIFVDDYRYVPDVTQAVHKFASETDYEIISESDPEDDRGIVYLRKSTTLEKDLSIKYINHIKTSFENAEKEQSKINEDILNLEGMTGKFTRHFYNNICSLDDCRYLEIGTWKGSSTCSAIYENECKITCIDNWSQFSGTKEELLSNINKFKNKNEVTFIENDSFKVDSRELGKFNVYLYDGDHSEESHYKGIVNFFDCLEDTSIVIVDDWNWESVREGTKKALHDLPLKIVYEQEKILPPEHTNDMPNHKGKDSWWNGIYVCVIQKEKNKSLPESGMTFGILTSGRKEPDTAGATVSVRSSNSSQSLLKTWGKDVPNIYFATDIDSKDSKFIKCSDRNDYKSTGEKQINLCLDLLKNKKPTQWYILADDDTYIYVDHLKQLLQKFQSIKKPLAIGKVINYCQWDRDLLYLSGGAGMAFNRQAFEKICEFFSVKENYEHHTKVQFYGDIAIGLAIKEFNIEIISCDSFVSRDPELTCDQLEQSKNIYNSFPMLRTFYTDDIISYHGISADRFLEQDWDKVKSKRDVCPK